MNAFDDNQRREIGARIRKVRNSLNDGKGISQPEAAVRLGVSTSHITKVELGISAFSPRFVESVAREFNVSERWLLTGEGEMMEAACVGEGRSGYVVRMVEKMDPTRIADLVLDPQLMVQAKGVSKLLGCDLRKAVELVIAQRLETPSKS